MERVARIAGPRGCSTAGIDDGLLPGYATPRIVCDVPHVGKRWVHQYTEYDRERGVSYWDGRYPYFDPISSLPPAGQAWWDAQSKED